MMTRAKNSCLMLAGLLTGFSIIAVELAAEPDCVFPPPYVRTIDFDGLPLESGSNYWNGADEQGGFYEQGVHFNNEYTDWGWGYYSWFGFAYSRVNDTNTAGFGNQYAVWTPGKGLAGTGLYAVASVDNYDDTINAITFPYKATVKGFYVNNTTYTALTIRDGDWLSAPFGIGDWFSLTISGRDSTGNPVGQKTVYLADFRDADPTNHYILGEWTWVDLAAFGTEVRTLHFAQDSSDVGAWGMNTPAYFAMDNLQYRYTFSGGLQDDMALDAGVPGFVGPDGIGVSGGDNYVNPVFAAWAVDADYKPVPNVVDASWTNYFNALGPVSADNTNVVSLGDLSQALIDQGVAPGSITLTFDIPVSDRAGPDFVVFENALGTASSVFAELAYVEVSSDGLNFARFPSVSLTPAEVGLYGFIDPRAVYNLAGRHVNGNGKSWGTPFDLAGLACHPLVIDETVDLAAISHIRLVDIPGNGAFTDCYGNPVYDAWYTWGSGGFDLDAVGIINSTEASRITISVTGPGSITPYGYPGGIVSARHGESRTFAITPAPGFHIADVIVDGISIGATNQYVFTNLQEDHSLEARFGSKLVIHDAFWVSEPSPGEYILAGDVAVALSAGVIEAGATQYVATGWSGTGSVPENGGGTAVSFSITNDSVISWQWQTNYWLEISTTGRGAVDLSSGWMPAGSEPVLTAYPDPYYDFAGWSGATAGDTNTPAMTLPMDRARHVTAGFYAEETSHGVPHGWLERHGLLDGTTAEEAAEALNPEKGTPVWQDFYAGIDPNDPDDVFAIIDFGQHNGSNYVSWRGGTNGAALPFAVMGSTNLTTGWYLLDGMVQRSTQGTNIWWHDSGATQMFYRIKVNME